MRKSCIASGNHYEVHHTAAQARQLHHDVLLCPLDELGCPFHRLPLTSGNQLLAVGDAIAQIITALARRPIDLPQNVVGHRVVELEGLGVLALIASAEFLPAISCATVLPELQPFVQLVPDLLGGLISRIPGIVHMDSHQSPETAIRMKGHKHPRDQLQFMEMDVLEGGLVLEIPQPSRFPPG